VNYVELFLKNPKEPLYIPCRDARQQENVRVSLFHRRRAAGNIADAIVGIRKETIDDKLYVVLYDRIPEEGPMRMVDGKLVPLGAQEYIGNPEVERKIRLMKEDGMSDEEIADILAGGKEEESGESE